MRLVLPDWNTQKATIIASSLILSELAADAVFPHVLRSEDAVGFCIGLSLASMSLLAISIQAKAVVQLLSSLILILSLLASPPSTGQAVYHAIVLIVTRALALIGFAARIRQDERLCSRHAALSQATSTAVGATIAVISALEAAKMAQDGRVLAHSIHPVCQAVLIGNVGLVLSIRRGLIEVQAEFDFKGVEGTPHQPLTSPLSPRLLVFLLLLMFLATPASLPVVLAPYALLAFESIRDMRDSASLVSLLTIVFGLALSFAKDVTPSVAGVIVSLHAVLMAIKPSVDEATSTGGKNATNPEQRILDNVVEALFHASILPSDSLTAQILAQHLPAMFKERPYTLKLWRSFPGERLVELLSMGRPLAIHAGDVDRLFPPFDRNHVTSRWKLRERMPVKETRLLRPRHRQPAGQEVSRMYLAKRRGSLRQEIARSTVSHVRRQRAEQPGGNSNSPIRRSFDLAAGIGTSFGDDKRLATGLIFSPGDSTDSVTPTESDTPVDSDEPYSTERLLPEFLTSISVVSGTSVATRTTKNCVVIVMYLEYEWSSGSRLHKGEGLGPPASTLSDIATVVGVTADRQLYTDQLRVRMAADSDRSRSQQFFLSNLQQRLQGPLVTIKKLTEEMAQDCPSGNGLILARSTAAVCDSVLTTIAGPSGVVLSSEVVIRDVIYLKSELFHRGRDFGVFVSRDVPLKVRVHAVSLIAVLDALLSNATNYTTDWVHLSVSVVPKGESARWVGTIDQIGSSSIRLSRVTAESDLLEIRVSNSGEGIPFRQFAKFEPFVGVDAQLHAGLSNSKYCVEDIGGALEVESANGVTTVTLLTPLDNTDPAPISEPLDVDVDVQLPNLPHEREAMAGILGLLGARVVEGALIRVEEHSMQTLAMSVGGRTELITRPASPSAVRAAVQAVLGRP
ncbi:Histidine kinase- DNA gyrase B- and HSP90-like ATPase [Carpediemonas membranifera]|uniref:Histidine kinase- DNA gyrase B- and HSP90-like ATPase n=1 Tax=Carpediemonas membranifera TaxID=201153 RepID=A0A8J6EAN2_9EUKA|nr:Histidine kinase- DNA gyrase B- and HSP90-like ATPase [Carpediemonas membranifera]|eukprot:KAG9394945.1 Histidine kinase- DNA gyrase B- and HSP90-like ATPase [Carpediemonas membranifera]